MKGVIHNQEKHIWDLKISDGKMGEAVNGGAVLGVRLYHNRRQKGVKEGHYLKCYFSVPKRGGK